MNTNQCLICADRIYDGFHICRSTEPARNSPYEYKLMAHYAAGVSRRQVENCTKIVKNVTIIGFHYHIWNHHGKYIQMSTDIPGIGSVIYEISFE